MKTPLSIEFKNYDYAYNFINNLTKDEYLKLSDNLFNDLLKYHLNAELFNLLINKVKSFYDFYLTLRINEFEKSFMKYLTNNFNKQVITTNNVFKYFEKYKSNVIGLNIHKSDSKNFYELSASYNKLENALLKDYKLALYVFTNFDKDFFDFFKKI